MHPARFHATTVGAICFQTLNSSCRTLRAVFRLEGDSDTNPRPSRRLRFNGNCSSAVPPAELESLMAPSAVVVGLRILINPSFSGGASRALQFGRSMGFWRRPEDLARRQHEPAAWVGGLRRVADYRQAGLEHYVGTGGSSLQSQRSSRLLKNCYL